MPRGMRHMPPHSELHPDGLYPGYHPGEFLAEEMEARGWTDKDVASECGMNALHIKHIRLGNTLIDIDVAANLKVAFDIPIPMWLAMEAGRWKTGV